MMKVMIRAGVAGVVAILTGAAAGDPPYPAVHVNPLLGTWKVVADQVQCVETEVYEADGHHRITSGQEMAVSEYSVSAEPSSAGYYRVVDKVMQTNGERDCTGNLTPIGDVAVIYVRFEDGGNTYHGCEAEDPKSCFETAHRM